MNTDNITLRELTRDELPSIWPLISEANAQMTRERFDSLLTEMIERGYQCIAAFDGEVLAGICGYWFGAQFWCGRYMELDNVRVHPDYRRHQVGAKLLEEAERIATKQGCELSWLKSYTHNTEGHKFFTRNDYWIQGFLFRKNF